MAPELWGDMMTLAPPRTRQGVVALTTQQLSKTQPSEMLPLPPQPQYLHKSSNVQTNNKKQIAHHCQHGLIPACIPELMELNRERHIEYALECQQTS